MDLRNRTLMRLGMFVLVAVGLALPAFSQKPEGADVGSAKAPKTPAEALYCVEFRGPCGPAVMPGFLGEKILSAFVKEGMHVSLAGDAPLVSREDLKYSLVATQRETDLRAGRIYAEVGPGSELTFKNKDGKSVVLQIDITQACWDLDRSAAIAKAKESKADYVFLARFQVEDLTADVNTNEKLGKQKSFRVNLDVVGVSTSSGQVVASFSEERRQMDVSREGAISKAAKHLAEKAAGQFKDAAKKGSFSW